VRIKHFLGRSAAEAAEAARREIGPDAVVLQSRRVPAQGWRRLLRRYDRVQLTVAWDEAGRPAPDRPPTEPAPAAAAPPPTQRVLLAESPQREAERQRLRALQAGGPRLGPPQPISPRRGERRLVVLVGPTGAGKTTTIAKLAAILHLAQGWRVALVSADTFRVGAVDQLTAYARLLGLGLEVAATPRALQRVVERHADADVVLVDTSGRSHRDAQRMDELAAFLQAAAGAEIHLVLPATLRDREAAAVAAAYRRLGASRLLLTKLDECEQPEGVLELAASLDLPLSYWTSGQRVPEDIAVAWPDELLAWLQAARRASS
jgi:flagellar biosynthesis GTPase FlhF